MQKREMRLTITTDLPEIFIITPIRRWIGIRERHGPRPRIPPIDRFRDCLPIEEVLNEVEDWGREQQRKCSDDPEKQ